MKLLVVRHGQTDWNIQKRIQGRTDNPLNEVGIMQAHETKEILKNEKIDLIICSNLKRAKQTAEIINENRNIPMKYDDSIIEISYGENEGKNASEFDYVGIWYIDKCVKYKDAENVNDVIKRVYTFLDNIKDYEEKNILLVTHNGVCRVINTYFNGIPTDKDIIKLGVKNCEVVKYDI